MKPFDLEAAKRSEPLVTRDGREVAEFHYFITDKSKYPCAAMIEGACAWYSVEGTEYVNGESRNDLFMAPKIVTKYLNVYASPSAGSYPGNQSAVFDNLGDAEKNADRNTMKILVRALPIEIEELDETI